MMILTMKTIAVSIDEATLGEMRAHLQRTDAAGRPPGGLPRKRATVSEVVRRALREYIERQREQRDGRLLDEHAAELNRDAHELVRRQAKL